jgi:hypothetical protein
LTVLLLGVTAGCGYTRALVLDDLTDQPVAGATITPFVDGLFGTTEVTHTHTDNDGRATVPYRDAFFKVTHPELRQVNPHDKPSSNGDERLLYLRRPPRVVVLLPDGFIGPVVVSGNMGNEQDREPTYRLALPPDPLQPIQVPGLLYGLVRLEEIEAERQGVSIMPAKGAANSVAIHIWVPQQPSGMFYERDFVHLLFVGTSESFTAFERALYTRLGRGWPPKRLDRLALEELRSAASANSATW